MYILITARLLSIPSQQLTHRGVRTKDLDNHFCYLVRVHAGNSKRARAGVQSLI